MKICNILENTNIDFSTSGVPVEKDSCGCDGHESSESPEMEQREQALGEIEVNTALMIRLLEWAHEDAKDDVEIHKVVEKLQELFAKHNMLTMDHYDEIMSVVTTTTDEV